jgi:hypothetical protein
MLDLFLAIGIALAFVVLILAISYQSSPTRPAAIRSRISQCLVVAHLLVYVAPSAYDYSLADAGASNPGVWRVPQIIVVGLAFCWALYRLASTRGLLLSYATLYLPLAALTTLYFLSILWSVETNLSLLRTVEFFSILVLAIDSFSAPHARRLLAHYAFLVVTAYLFIGVAGFRSMADLLIFAGVRSNTAALLAAILVLMALYSQDRARLRVFWLACGAYGLFVFGSTASIGALLAAVRAATVLFTRFAISALFILLAAGFMMLRADAPFELAVLADFLGKRPENLQNWTGRLPLWSGLLDAVAVRPQGYGFGSERHLGTLVPLDLSKVGWAPQHSHSGFFSAFVSVGPVGALAVLMAILWPLRVLSSRATWSVGRRSARHLDFAQRRGLIALPISATFLIALNNLTIVGVGGPANPALVALVGVCASAYWGSDALWPSPSDGDHEAGARACEPYLPN